MFKGKKSLYILLPVNILVWGFIGYKIVMAFQGDDLPGSVAPAINYAGNSEKDTVHYTLMLNYDDPFLKQEPVKRVNPHQYNSAVPAPVVVKPVKPMVAETKPAKEIKYLGIIQNKSSGTMMALISINGNSYTVKKGDVIEGLSFKNITPSFIEVKDGKKNFKVDKG